MERCDRLSQFRARSDLKLGAIAPEQILKWEICTLIAVLQGRSLLGSLLGGSNFRVLKGLDLRDR